MKSFAVLCYLVGVCATQSSQPVSSRLTPAQEKIVSEIDKIKELFVDGSRLLNALRSHSTSEYGTRIEAFLQSLQKLQIHINGYSVTDHDIKHATHILTYLGKVEDKVTNDKPCKASIESLIQQIQRFNGGISFSMITNQSYLEERAREYTNLVNRIVEVRNLCVPHA